MSSEHKGSITNTVPVKGWNEKREQYDLPELEYDLTMYRGRWTKKRSRDLQDNREYLCRHSPTSLTST